MVTLTSREFNQHTNKAKILAISEPVVVTSRGRPGHVLLSYQKFLDLAAGSPTLGAAFAQLPDTADIAVEFPRSAELPRSAVFD